MAKIGILGSMVENAIRCLTGNNQESMKIKTALIKGAKNQGRGVEEGNEKTRLAAWAL